MTPGRLLRTVAVAIGLLVFAAGGAAAWWWWSALAPRDAAGTVQLFTVPRGATLARVGSELETAGLVNSALAFQLLGRWEGAAPKLHWGEYEISAAMTPREILTRMVEGRVKTYDVTLPEGLAAREIGDRLAAATVIDRGAFEALLQDPASAARFGVEGPGLEGYLFPDTYRFPHGLSAVEIVRALVDRFQKAWAGVAQLAAAQGLSQREVVTLASIVEKETGLAAERPLVASVFLNRLRRGMRLESDPTVIYGIAGFDGNLRRTHLDDDTNPYNTYQIARLPPGPIASPGDAALRAVVEPAATEYLFFVGKGDGSHLFSERYEDHVRAVNRYQRRGDR
jgi:UPF0755 protein